MAGVKKRPLQKVARVGSKVDYGCSVAEYGTDDQGPFVILNVLEDSDPNTKHDVCFVKAIDTTGEGSVTFGDWIDVGSIKEGDEHVDAQPSVLGVVPETEGAFHVGNGAALPEHANVSPEVEKKLKAEKLAKKAASLKFKEPLPPVHVNEVLNVRLTEEERTTAARNASNLLGQLYDEKESLKAIQTDRKAKIKGLEEQISRLKSAHNTGLEFRPVLCEQRFDVEKGMTWFIYRGEEYGMRPMNEKEQRETRQKSLFGDAPVLPNRVDPKTLPKAKDLGGDALAKAAPKDLVPGQSVEVNPLHGEPSPEAMEKRAARKGKPARADSVLPNGRSRDADVAAVMSAETSKKGGKKDHVSL